MKILIVGEDKRIDGLNSFLEGQGHTVLSTPDRDKLLFVFARNIPDLLIMPGTSEYVEALDMIREINQGTECILITDTSDKDEIDLIFNVKEANFISWPIDLELLETKISYCSDRLKVKAEQENKQLLSDLILHGLPFPAMLISDCGEKLVLANRSARELNPDDYGISQIPFFHVIDKDLVATLFSHEASYNQQTLAGVKAYGRYWNISVEQVLPGIFLFTAQDITQQRNQLQLREEIERIARHDLRSPTATIIGFGNVLESESELSEENKMIASTIRKTAERMIRIIDTSLTLIRLENGSFTPDMHPFNLMNALTAAETDVSQIVMDKSLNIEWFMGNSPLPQGVPLVTYGEASMVVTMFSNLIKNAVEAAPMGTTVTIRIRDLGSIISTEIHNSGEVPKEIKNNFFDRYATSGKKYGTGLGTHSARLIARIMGGDISFTSSEDEGTTLKVMLPKPPQKDQ
jgi:signal transduction histidine kinase